MKLSNAIALYGPDLYLYTDTVYDICESVDDPYDMVIVCGLVWQRVHAETYYYDELRLGDPEIRALGLWIDYNPDNGCCYLSTFNINTICYMQ